MDTNNEITQLNRQINQKLAQEKKHGVPWRGIMAGVGATIGISLLAGGSFMAGMKFSGLNRNLPAVTRGPEEPTPTPNPTAGWKEYVTAWYSFKISPEWQRVEGGKSESGIILVTNNLDYTDFGNIKSGALIYIPVKTADKAILDTLLSENLKRGYKLITKQQIKAGEIQGTEIIIDSPLGSRETQFRFSLASNQPMFLSLVGNLNEKDKYYREFQLMLSSLKLLTPQNLSRFSHPDGLFRLDYPAEMKIEKTERTLPGYQKAEDWEFTELQAAVTLTVETFRSRSLQDKARNKYQKVVTENRVGEVFSTRVVAGQTALQYIELTNEGKRKVVIYIDLPGDFILTAVYYDESAAKQAAETMLNSLVIGNLGN